MHGAQPDALVLCHDPNRPHMRGLPEYQLPDLLDCIRLNGSAPGSPTRPAAPLALRSTPRTCRKTAPPNCSKPLNAKPTCPQSIRCAKEPRAWSMPCDPLLRSQRELSPRPDLHHLARCQNHRRCRRRRVGPRRLCWPRRMRSLPPLQRKRGRNHRRARIAAPTGRSRPRRLDDSTELAEV